MKSFCFFFFLIFTTASSAIEIGSPAPNCDLKEVYSGTPVELTKPGKVLYVDFWASWCGPCEQSMPFLDQINTELKAKNFEVIAINLDETKEDAEQFLKNHKVNFTVAMNPDNQCPNSYGVLAMPSSYLIDKQGKIRFIQLGFRTEEKAELRAKIEKLLAE